MRDDSRKGSGGSFWREPIWRALLSCRFSSALASVRILDAKQRSSSCGFQTWPLGRTRSPVRLVRQLGWFSARDTGFWKTAREAQRVR